MPLITNQTHVNTPCVAALHRGCLGDSNRHPIVACRLTVLIVFIHSKQVVFSVRSYCLKQKERAAWGVYGGPFSQASATFTCFCLSVCLSIYREKKGHIAPCGNMSFVVYKSAGKVSVVTISAFIIFTTFPVGQTYTYSYYLMHCL